MLTLLKKEKEETSSLTVSGVSSETFYGKKVNLNDISVVRKQVDATFICLEWFSVSDIARNPDKMEALNNIGIREVQVSEEEDSLLESSFLSRGLDLSIPPICIDQDGNIRDGRRRVKTHIKNGEYIVPVARYNYQVNSSLIPQETELSNNIGNGLYSNNPYNPSRPNVKNDWVWAGVKVVQDGDIPATNDDLSRWFKKYGIEERYPSRNKKTNPAITEIINKVIKTLKKGKNQMKTFDIKSATEWVKNCPNAPDIDNDSTFLVNVNNQTYSLRFYESMIRKSYNYNPNEYVANVILYTTCNDSDLAEKQMKDFVKFMDELFERNANMFGVMEAFRRKTWKVLGCIPQNSVKHNLNSRSLIKVENYGK